MSRFITCEDIISAAEAWVAAARKTRSAEINAGSCRTSRDWDKLHEAREEEADAEIAFLQLAETLRP